MAKSKNSIIKNGMLDYEIENLIDLKDIKINKELTVEERNLCFVEQIKNPYLFKIDNVIVKVNFNENGLSFQDQFENYLKNCLEN